LFAPFFETRAANSRGRRALIERSCTIGGIAALFVFAGLLISQVFGWFCGWLVGFLTAQRK
jgi:hypothetical protein